MNKIPVTCALFALFIRPKESEKKKTQIVEEKTNIKYLHGFVNKSKVKELLQITEIRRVRKCKEKKETLKTHKSQGFP